ncbi:MAG: hypothetical protein K1X83_15115, partial [Oligoflexia bacterium]|nr:hypothetical protein [Oligoflexia bacterium]
TLKSSKSVGKSERPPTIVPTLDDLVFQSEATQKLLRSLKTTAAKNSSCIILQGPAGSGLSTLATALCAESQTHPVTTILDLARAGADLPERAWGLLMRGGNRQTIIVDHAEFDDGSACVRIAELLQNNSNLQSGGAGPRLIVLCTDPAATRPWLQHFEADVITVPSLDQSRNDIPNLVQRFTRECQELTDLKVRHPSAETVSWLSGLDWPGQTKQLRACVMHALVDGAISDTDFKLSVEEQREVWLATQQVSRDFPIDPILAAQLLETLNHDYRAAAARLGCSVPQLQEVLR